MFLMFKRKLRHALAGGCTPSRRSGHGCGRPRGFAAMTDADRAQLRDRVVDRMAKKLLLNAEQKPLLSALLEQLQSLRQALSAQTPDLRAEVRSWIAGPALDATRLQALVHDKNQVLQDQSPAVVAALAAFYDSLNPAQQQKVRDRLEGRRGWFLRRTC